MGDDSVLVMQHVPLDTDVGDGPGIAIWTINRPDKLNALNSEVNDAIISAAKDVEKNDSVRVVIIRGAPPPTPEEGERGMPPAFVAGADISEFVGVDSKQIRKAFKADPWAAVWNISKPTIAMVDGFALGGGCELALACDIRLASTRSMFGTPEINLGLIPGGGATQRLARLVGYGKALEMVMSGELMPATEAHRVGLANYVLPAEQLEEVTMTIARNLAGKSPHTIRVAKRAVRAALERPLSEGVRFERDEFCALFDTDDKEIGVQAFLDRSDPEWTGS
jgi:enoyl-CoA hydratase